MFAYYCFSIKETLIFNCAPYPFMCRWCMGNTEQAFTCMDMFTSINSPNVLCSCSCESTEFTSDNKMLYFAVLFPIKCRVWRGQQLAVLFKLWPVDVRLFMMVLSCCIIFCA